MDGHQESPPLHCAGVFQQIVERAAATTDAMTRDANSAGPPKPMAVNVFETAPHLKALARADKSQLGAAEGSLRQWLNDHPTDVVALKLLGNVCLRLSRHEEAEEQLSKALALAPQFTEARWLLVGTFVYRGNWK